MSASIIPEHEPQIQPRNPFARPGPIPDWRLEGLYLESVPSLVARAEASSTSSTASSATSCGPNDNSGACEKYYGSSGSDTTLPIVLGVVIPLGIALIVLLFLHRRHVRKLRREDAEDRHKSLDFGLDGTKAGGVKPKARNLPEMSMADGKDMGIRRGRGLSLDLTAPNPYLLPAGLQNSRESIHSLSRLNTGDDRYRPTDFIPDDGSIRPPSSARSPHDDSSSFTGSSSRRFRTDSRQNFLPSGAPLPGRNTPADAASGNRRPPPPSKGSSLLAVAPEVVHNSVQSTTSSLGAVNALRASNNYLGQFISGGTPASKQETEKKESIATVKEVKVDTPVVHVQPPPPVFIKDSLQSNLPPPSTLTSQDQTLSKTNSTQDAADGHHSHAPQLNLPDSQVSQHRTSPPEDFQQPVQNTVPSTSQHNVIPSGDFTQSTSQAQNPLSQDHTQNSHQGEEDDYYDEYEAYDQHDPAYYDEQDYQDFHEFQEQMGYDPRRSMMGMRPLPPDDPSENPEDRANRIRSFYKEYFDDSKHPNHTRTAQYYDGAEGYYDNYGQGQNPQGYHGQQSVYHPRGMSQNVGYGRHRATISNGSYQTGPRAYSTASGQYGGPRMPPKKKLPAPTALHVLPTPSKLKEDTFLPIDFAPPQKYSKQRSGTPDSLKGGLSPYSPSVRSHVPLASSFDDLAVMPSPHQLRKSATFTALDFAPPGRLRANDTGSETGSIRSNRSGVSAVHLHNIRTGAYRVSRIPKEMAGTKDELTAALRPQWDFPR